MAEKALRGSRMGGQSFEDDTAIDFAPRQLVGFVCPNDHVFEIPMAVDAEVPTRWECPRCGSQALRADGQEPETRQVKPPRTHWDMLRERRSMPELEEILAERLTLLRSGQIGPERLHRARATKARSRAKKTA